MAKIDSTGFVVTLADGTTRAVAGAQIKSMTCAPEEIEPNPDDDDFWRRYEPGERSIELTNGEVLNLGKKGTIKAVS